MNIPVMCIIIVEESESLSIMSYKKNIQKLI